jgi:hypothetical protein
MIRHFLRSSPAVSATLVYKVVDIIRGADIVPELSRPNITDRNTSTQQETETRGLFDVYSATIIVERF